MEKFPPPARKPETQEDTKSVLIASENHNKRMTSVMSPESIDATFTVETFSKFNPAEISLDDRAYIHTASGNMYRIDRSESRPNLLKTLNQNSGNTLDYIVPIQGESQIIEVGKKMNYGLLEDPDDFNKGVTGWTSTEVQKIEVWRNYLKAIREIEADLKARHRGEGGFSTLAKALGREARGAIRTRDYTKRDK